MRPESQPPLSGRRTPTRLRVGSRLLTIDDMRQRAARLGGQCLSDAYVNIQGKLRWRCAQGHEWIARASTVQQGKWCPECRKQPGFTIADMKALAGKRGGTCLSNTYVNTMTKLRWRCAQGHEWDATPALIKTQRWCPTCAGRRLQRLSLALLRDIAAERGGACLSDTYARSVVKLRWACANGHQWEAPASQVRDGRWCPTCEGRRTRPTLADMQALAAGNGGDCLSDRYLKAFVPLRWACANGHQWEAPASQVRDGRWCPTCAKTKDRSRQTSLRQPLDHRADAPF